MISDIEDDVKREIDRNTKKDTTNTSSADLREKDRDYDLREETIKVGYNNDKDKCCSRAKISKSGKRRKSFFCNNFFKIVQKLIL